MDQIAEKIALFHNLFLGCMALAVICFIIAVIVFFVLDIKDVIGYLTGRQARKRIRELEESNAKSGRLMNRERSMQYVDYQMQEDMGVRQTAKPGARKVEHVVENTGVEDTSILEEEVKPETEPELQLSDSTAMLGEDREASGRFIIRREIMLIHAEEVI